MRISRKVAALAVVGVFACTGVAFALVANYQFKDGNGNVVPSGTFGENFGVKDDGGITLTVAGGAATNTCHFQITGQVVNNDGSGTLRALLPGHVFYGCDHATVTAQGNWSLTVGQNQKGPVKTHLNYADVLLHLGGGVACEFKGNGAASGGPVITMTNGGDVSSGGAATTGVVSGGFTRVDSTYNQTCPFPVGTPATASGNVVISASSNATDNLTIH